MRRICLMAILFLFAAYSVPAFAKSGSHSHTTGHGHHGHNSKTSKSHPLKKAEAPKHKNLKAGKHGVPARGGAGKTKGNLLYP